MIISVCINIDNSNRWTLNSSYSIVQTKCKVSFSFDTFLQFSYYFFVFLFFCRLNEFVFSSTFFVCKCVWWSFPLFAHSVFYWTIIITIIIALYYIWCFSLQARSWTCTSQCTWLYYALSEPKIQVFLNRKYRKLVGFLLHFSDIIILVVIMWLFYKVL